MATDENIVFDPFTSRVESGFWHELGRRKLEKYKLSEAEQCIRGSYSNGTVPGLPSHFTLEYQAFNDPEDVPSNSYESEGILLNTNTIDAFKDTDKKKLLESLSLRIWEDICSGAVIENPKLLSRFFLLTFSDLKKFNFYYWFLFPALLPEEPFTCQGVEVVTDTFSSSQVSCLTSSYDKFRKTYPGVGFFLIQVLTDDILLHPLRNFDCIKSEGKVLLGFGDPSTLNSNPGWPLRNLLVLAAKQWGHCLECVDVLCYRDYTRDGRRVNTHSLVIKKVKLSNFGDRDGKPKSVGWERNDRNKLAPRIVNLSSSMDPVKLSESSVDLNLKLMRWRLLPSLDLELISQTRCLLLGAGTLGCNVARCLLGWGVRNITLVDNGTVSYSNPVRQSLFSFKDCEGGGAPKAARAAESLKMIFPGVNSTGIDLSIPMPGHSIGANDETLAKVREEVKILEDLVSSHDAVFLLMDTRESRWLPTLLCASHSKLCLNAALGFDTYMVMRHGYRSGDEVHETESSRKIPGSELACYFCSDVVAPTNSTRDRTLDQQCTVSRPGLSMIAGALAVELLMSVLQHPNRGLAFSENLTDDDETECESVLGLVPHQIRGFMSRYHNVLPASRRFDKCTACSEIVLQQYKKEGFDFLLKSFNSPNYLEELTGLSDLYVQTYDDQVWEFSDDETFN